MHGLKKSALTTTTTTTAATRRPALGNLLNRTDKARVLNDKKAINPNGSNENCNLTNGTGIDLKNVKARVDTHWKNEPLRKPASLARNNSIQKTSVTGITTLASNTHSGPKLVKAKTSETATLKSVKLVDKSERPAIKRQDSTLTRRKVITGTKTATVDATKRTVTRTKSSDSDSDAAASKVIIDVPVVQSRFRPPTFSSYSNGLINGVSIFGHFLFFFENIYLVIFRNLLIYSSVYFLSFVFIVQWNEY